MSDFAVVVPAVEQIALRCRAVGADLSAELAALRQEAEAVLAGEWRGPAATAFDRDWSLWLAGARDVITALDGLADRLMTSAHAYAARDEMSAGLLQGVGR